MSLPLLGRRNLPWRGFVYSSLILGILLIPLIVWQPLSSGQLQWIRPPTLSIISSQLLELTGNRPSLLLYTIICTMTLLAVLRTPPYQRGEDELWCHLFVALWILAPLAVTLVFSWVVRPVFVSRYLIISLPALALLAGAGISRLKRPLLQAAILLLMLCLSTRAIFLWYFEHPKHDWRSATQYVVSESKPGDGAAFYVDSGRKAFAYYQERLDGNPTGLTILELFVRKHGRAIPDLNEPLFSSLPGTYDRIWLILNFDRLFRDRPDRDRIVGTIENSYTKVQERDFIGIRVLLYKRAHPDVEIVQPDE